MTAWTAPLRLRLDGTALVANWRWLDRMSGPARCGAAVKANGYGLGAKAVVERLSRAGCRDFFVANWGEAKALAPLSPGVLLSVLNGVRSEDMALARSGIARPVLNTLAEVKRWRGQGPCDVMIDTGMNRLGLSIEDVRDGALDGMEIVNLMSHLACADDDVAMNTEQRAVLLAAANGASYQNLSLANSAGVCLGPDYRFDLTRPGVALYGGIPHAAAAGHIRQVVTPEVQILQRRRVEAGQVVGYNAIFTAVQTTEVAILNIGYADGYRRNFSGTGRALAGDTVLPVLGRVSMDLLAIDVSAAPELREGDWVSLDYDLPRASAQSGLSQYELLTGLGARFDRVWVD